MTQRKCPDCPLVPALCQTPERDTRAGKVIHFQELELYGINITRVVQAMLQAMLQAHMDVDVLKGVKSAETARQLSY